MSTAIPLLNLEQRHLGFVLLAGLPEEYVSSVGEWEGDCVLMGPPEDAELIETPENIVISEYHVRGEHRVKVSNDGTVVSFEIRCPTQDPIYMKIPLNGLGPWGTRNGISEIQLGYTCFINT